MIPVYQGEHTLGSLIQEIALLTVPTPTAGGHEFEVIEVLLVNDQGPDRSDEVTRELALAYDAAGNRTTVTGGGQNATYTADSLNQYTQVSSFGTPSYDGNGNLTGLGSAQYTYDAQNRMVGALVGSNTVYCFYDARNRCVARTSNGHINLMFYDGWNPICSRSLGRSRLPR